MADQVQLVSFEAMFRALVRAELASLGIATTIATVYSSESRELYPPGRYSADARKAKRAACDRIKRVPGAKKIGAGIYSVSRAAYEAHYARRSICVRNTDSSLRAELTGEFPSDDDAGVAAALEACGLRATRRGAA